jgi:hypothetical protein
VFRAFLAFLVKKGKKAFLVLMENEVRRAFLAHLDSKETLACQAQWGPEEYLVFVETKAKQDFLVNQVHLVRKATLVHLDCLVFRELKVTWDLRLKELPDYLAYLARKGKPVYQVHLALMVLLV